MRLGKSDNTYAWPSLETSLGFTFSLYDISTIPMLMPIKFN